MKRMGRRLVEQALAVVFRWKAIGEPVGEAGSCPAVEMQNGLL